MRRIAIALGLVAGSVAADSAEDLYLTGSGVEALLSNGSVRVSATQFPCAGCHGNDGQGGGEGATRSPPIVWESLAKTTTQRPAYKAQSFSRAVTKGIASDGRPLSAVMPRYILDQSQISGLIGYLQALGAAQSTGVGATTIRFRDSENPDVSNGFAHAIAEFNLDGGAFGRTIELVNVGENFLDIDAVVEHLRLRLLTQSQDMLIERIAADGHLQVRLLSDKTDPELIYRLRQQGITVDANADAALITSPLENLPASQLTIYAPLDLIGSHLSQLSGAANSIVIVSPNTKLTAVAVRQRQNKKFVDGLLTGELAANAILRTDRNLTRAKFWQAFDQIDTRKSVSIMSTK